MVGGRKGDRAVRSFRPDQLYAASAPRPRPFVGRGARPSAGLSMDMPRLTTDRLILRPFVAGDLADLVRVHAEESFWWYPLRAAMTKEQTEHFLHRTHHALCHGRFRHRGRHRSRERRADRVGRSGHPSLLCPRCCPRSKSGGGSQDRIEAAGWPPRGGPGRRSMGLHRRRAVAHRQHLRAGESRLGPGDGASQLRAVPHHARIPSAVSALRGHRAHPRPVGEASARRRASRLLDRVAVHAGQNAQHHLVRPGADGVEPGVAVEAGSPVLRHVGDPAVELHGDVGHLALQP